VRQRLHQQRLGQPWHAHQQTVASGKERIQRRHDDILLPDNHLGHLILQQSNPRRELVEHLGGIALDYWRHFVNGMKCGVVSHNCLFVCCVYFVVSPDS